MPFPYRILLSPDYNDQIGEMFISTNNTLNSKTASYLGDINHRNSSNHTQYVVSERQPNYTEISSHVEEVAGEKPKKTRIKKDVSSQVNRLLTRVSIISLWIFAENELKN